MVGVNSDYPRLGFSGAVGVAPSVVVAVDNPWEFTGFSVTRGGKVLTRTLKVLGNGTELASAEVNHGTSEKIEAWFRAHPEFGSSNAAPAPAQVSPPLDGRLVADELTKLAGLRDAGVLTEAEFAAQKAKLLD